MILTVFDAAGPVGKRIVRAALNQGHHVRAFGRNVEGFIDEDLRNDHFEAIRGYVFDKGEVFNALKDSDAVLSALDGGINANNKTRSLGMKNIIAQMKKSSVRRIVAVGSIGVLADDTYGYIANNPDYPAMQKPAAIEYLNAFEYMKTSGLDWTFVCCPDITDADATGKYITSENYPPTPNLFYISAGNLALFMLNEISVNSFIRKRVGISDTN